MDSATDLTLNHTQSFQNETEVIQNNTVGSFDGNRNPPYPVYFFPSSGRTENNSEANLNGNSTTEPMPIEVKTSTTTMTTVTKTTLTSDLTRQFTNATTDFSVTELETTTPVETTVTTHPQSKASTTSIKLTSEILFVTTTVTPLAVINKESTTVDEQTFKTSPTKVPIISKATERLQQISNSETTDSETLNESINTTTEYANTALFSVKYSEEDFDSRDAFWPIAMALTIGIPTIVVFGVTIAVLYKRRISKPRGLLSMYGQEYS